MSCIIAKTVTYVSSLTVTYVTTLYILTLPKGIKYFYVYIKVKPQFFRKYETNWSNRIREGQDPPLRQTCKTNRNFYHVLTAGILKNTIR